MRGVWSAYVAWQTNDATFYLRSADDAYLAMVLAVVQLHVKCVEAQACAIICVDNLATGRWCIRGRPYRPREANAGTGQHVDG